MARSRNNLLGVGGQRKKLSRADRNGAGQGRAADRRTADDQKQELLRKMRERALGAEGAEGAESAGTPDAAPEGTGRE
ncbi:MULTISPECIES: DUF6243 family protein [unclassified Streptomyces]|uniref:DUF6243 family protein n=1 Tax=unclassified Streptomyces TaxID=2593676 RepID=UPI0006ADD21A|nr:MULTISPECIES: DUF6243 family protein [unclassified Streptomyces]KOX30848.1 hypothetical protein ADL06_11860 [Streptomyces sp. NRRL F-6491]KOX39736.1 hypothetical protein ADL08_24525 [Streptomyces sp. NRRL F-6492]